MPASKEALSALLERVEAATGPSRWLDAAIRDALYAPEKRPGWNPYTASIDSALALVNEMLPGFEYSITNMYGIAHAELPLNAADGEHVCQARREDGNMPLAIVEALLSALIAQAPTQNVSTIDNAREDR